MLLLPLLLLLAPVLPLLLALILPPALALPLLAVLQAVLLPFAVLLLLLLLLLLLVPLFTLLPITMLVLVLPVLHLLCCPLLSAAASGAAAHTPPPRPPRRHAGSHTHPVSSTPMMTFSPAPLKPSTPPSYSSRQHHPAATMQSTREYTDAHGVTTFLSPYKRCGPPASCTIKRAVREKVCPETHTN